MSAPARADEAPTGITPSAVNPEPPQCLLTSETTTATSEIKATKEKPDGDVVDLRGAHAGGLLDSSVREAIGHRLDGRDDAAQRS